MGKWSTLGTYNAMNVQVRVDMIRERMADLGLDVLDLMEWTGLSDTLYRFINTPDPVGTIRLDSLDLVCRALGFHPEDVAVDPNEVHPLTKPWMEWDLDGFLSFLARMPCYRDDPRFAPYRDRPLPGPIPTWDRVPKARPRPRPEPEPEPEPDVRDPVWVPFHLTGEDAVPKARSWVTCLKRRGIRGAMRAKANGRAVVWVRIQDPSDLATAREMAPSYRAKEGSPQSEPERAVNGQRPRPLR